MNDADDPRIDGYNARTIRELEAERARYAALVAAAERYLRNHPCPVVTAPHPGVCEDERRLEAALRAALDGEPR